MRDFSSGLLTLACAALVAALPALAQPSRAPSPAPPAQAQPNLAIPQQTTASFADWTLRCTHPTPGSQACEIIQSLTSQERTVAEMAIGRAAKGQPMHLTILVPPSVSFGAAPSLATIREAEPPVVEMAWRRCLPGGCMAEGTVSDDALRRVRGWTEPARIVFADGNGRAAALPFSPRGLPQALDALAKEDGG